MTNDYDFSDLTTDELRAEIVNLRETYRTMSNTPALLREVDAQHTAALAELRRRQCLQVTALPEIDEVGRDFLGYDVSPDEYADEQ